MELFGKSGTKLLPLMAGGADGIEELQEQARRLGLTMSSEDAQAAESFGDTLSALWKVLKMGVFTIGSALAPALSDLAEWIMRHRQDRHRTGSSRTKDLVVTIVKVAAAVLAGGVALVDPGHRHQRDRHGLGAIATVIGGIGTAVGLLGTMIGGALVAHRPGDRRRRRLGGVPGHEHRSRRPGPDLAGRPVQGPEGHRPGCLAGDRATRWPPATSAWRRRSSGSRSRWNGRRASPGWKRSGRPSRRFFVETFHKRRLRHRPLPKRRLGRHPDRLAGNDHVPDQRLDQLHQRAAEDLEPLQRLLPEGLGQGQERLQRHRRRGRDRPDQ